MSMTLVNLNLIKKDFSRTISNIASDRQVSRETEYYKANIGKITSVDEFLKNDRLYRYAMKSFGLEDMTYAKGFMRKVLESDLTDDNSFANKLTDDRYRKFALAFNFGDATKSAQSDAQRDDVLGLYTQSISNENEQVESDTRYYTAMIDSVQNVDELLSNQRLRDYVLKNFGYDPDRYSYSHVRNILTSDVSDPNSYVNLIDTSTSAGQSEKQRALNLVNAFSFNTDGTVKNGKPQTDTQKAALTENYVLTVPSHKTPSAAAVNRAYYDVKIKAATNVTDITNDARMWEITRTALGLPSTFLKSTFENIVTSDLNDPGSYVNTQPPGTKASYEGIAKLFNFATDGTTTAGNAQTSEQENTVLSGYNTHYDDADELIQANKTKSYTNNIGTIKKASDLFTTANATILDMTLAAFGIKKGEFTNNQLLQALTSDLSDPKSFANRSRDTRLVKMAQDFNFDTKGLITPPKMAQSEATITETAKNYIIQKTRFLKEPELTTAKTKAKTEVTYYQTEVEKMKNVDDLLKNRRVLDVVLVSKGIDPKNVSDDFLKKIFKSDMNDPKSFLNTQTDSRYKQIVASFNFDAKGNLLQSGTSAVQDRGHLQSTVDNYYQNELEVQQGDENPGVRLALYFERKAQTVTSAYDILGDKALLEVFKTTYQMPDGFSNMKIEQQKALVEKKLNLSDLKDPEKVKKLIQRFTVFYDMANDAAASQSAFSADGNISADTLATLSQLRYRR